MISRLGICSQEYIKPTANCTATVHALGPVNLCALVPNTGPELGGPSGSVHLISDVRRELVSTSRCSPA
jgi:hypothetical protein